MPADVSEPFADDGGCARVCTSVCSVESPCLCADQAEDHTL